MKSGQFVCSADDLDDITRKIGTAVELHFMKHQAVKIELVVNALKTKYVLVGVAEHCMVSLGSSVTADQNVFG